MASVVTTRDTSWVTPRTFTTGELITKTILDVHVRDNLNALKSPAYFLCVIDEASDYTITAGGAFASVDATDLSATITTGGGTVMLTWTCSVIGAGATARGYFDVLVDASRLGGDDGLVVVGTDTSLASTAAVTFVAYATGLSAGSHTFTLQSKAVTQNIIIQAGAGTSPGDIHPRFAGIELL